jgi:hypothetical protein
MIKKYKQFLLLEADENKAEISQEIKDELKSMIDKTIEKSGGDFNSFADKFIKEPDDVKIEGLINDSDLFDFYLKWRNDVDPILNDMRFYDQSPSKLGAVGLYEYVVKGTQKAIEEVVKGLSGGQAKAETPEQPEQGEETTGDEPQ